MCKIPKLGKKVSAVINSVYRIISAIREQVQPLRGFARTEVGRIIRRNKSANRRIIVSALQIIESRLAVVVVSAVTYRIYYTDVV